LHDTNDRRDSSKTPAGYSREEFFFEKIIWIMDHLRTCASPCWLHDADVGNHFDNGNDSFNANHHNDHDRLDQRQCRTDIRRRRRQIRSSMVSV